MDEWEIDWQGQISISFCYQQGLFLVLLGAGSSFSYMGIQQVLNDWDDIVTEHWMELLGNQATFFCIL